MYIIKHSCVLVKLYVNRWLPWALVCPLLKGEDWKLAREDTRMHTEFSLLALDSKSTTGHWEVIMKWKMPHSRGGCRSQISDAHEWGQAHHWRLEFTPSVKGAAAAQSGCARPWWNTSPVLLGLHFIFSPEKTEVWIFMQNHISLVTNLLFFFFCFF